MVNFKNILFPVDMSESALAVVPFVQSIAGLYESDIHLLYVARSVEYLSVIQIEAPTLVSFNSELFDSAQKSLAEFKEAHFGNREYIKTAVILGYPSEEILGYVARKNIDLVIMGTHGRRGLEKVLFGSVAEQVVKTSPAPVLVINPHKVKLPTVEAF
jgi:nucleotide-binding universal stress UspA family protein